MKAVIEFALQHRWVPLLTLLVGLVVRLLKADTRLPITIPPRVRPWLAIALGLAAGVLERVATGVSWSRAVLDGLVAGLLPMLGHDLVVEWMRAGAEVAVPGLMLRPVRPAPAGVVIVDAAHAERVASHRKGVDDVLGESTRR